MHQRMSYIMVIGVPMKWHERIHAQLTERINEPMSQWINQSMIQWINEAVDQWISEWTNEQMNEWKEGRKEGWMDHGWMDGWVSHFSVLSYFFTQQPLRWGTSSLSDFSSEQQLIRATSALICLPASSSVASATCFFSLRSCYNTFSNLQLQSRIAQE